MDDLLSPDYEMEDLEVENEGIRMEMDNSRPLSQKEIALRKRIAYPYSRIERKRKIQRKNQRVLKIFGQRRRLISPILIPDSNITNLPERVKTLPSGIPTNVITTYSIPKHILKDVPNNILSTLRSNKESITAFSKTQLLEILDSFHLPKYIYSNLKSKFQLVSLIYEIIDEEYFALWLTRVFRHESSSIFSEGPLYKYHLAIETSDFSIEEKNNIRRLITDNGGNLDIDIDYTTDFVIFREYQTVDLSDIPNVRALNVRQLEEFIDNRIAEADYAYEKICEELPSDTNFKIENVDDLFSPVFVPSMRYQRNQNLFMKDGIPLFKYQNNEIIENSTEDDISQLEFVTQHPIPSSLKKIYLLTKNGGPLRRSTIQINNITLTFEYLAGIHFDSTKENSNTNPLLFYEIQKDQYFPLYKKNDDFLVLNYSNTDNPSLEWIENISAQPKITKIPYSFDKFIDKLYDPSEKYVFGFKNFHGKDSTKVREYLRDFQDLYFLRATNYDYNATHFYWKNTQTLQRAKFTLRKQLGQNNLKKVVPYEFPLFPDIEWILEVDIIHPYFLNILEENLNSSEFNGVLIFSPKNKNK